jgi:hypothetical protein
MHCLTGDIGSVPVLYMALIVQGPPKTTVCWRGTTRANAIRRGGRINPAMSPDEQDAAVLRIVKDRAEAKRRRALLESELQAAGKALHVISEALPLLGSPVVNIPVLLKLVGENAELLAPSKLAQMMKEYADLTAQIADLDASAKAAGIE